MPEACLGALLGASHLPLMPFFTSTQHPDSCSGRLGSWVFTINILSPTFPQEYTQAPEGMPRTPDSPKSSVG